jgi:hypothetical protein
MFGTTISHYKVLEKLGNGGMGKVFFTKDSRLDRVLIVFGENSTNPVFGRRSP